MRPHLIALFAALVGCSNSADIAPVTEPDEPIELPETTTPAETLPAASMPEVESKRPDDIHRWVLLGIDGVDARVVDDMWARGKMRNLKRLCSEGVCSESSSAWASSPVIWTTVATGVVPEKHGIDRFVNETMDGRTPVGANDRKVGTIWDISSSVGYKTAQLGWWATWPAYEINGASFSARAGKDLAMKDRVKPASLQATFDAEFDQAMVGREERFDHCDHMGVNDAWVSHWTPKVVADDYDLVVAYMRCIDVVSHKYWGYWETSAFPKLAAADIEAHKDILPNNYEAADVMVGSVIDALPPDTNVIVLSDHGFEATPNFVIQVRLHTDKLLAELGYATVDDKGTAIPSQSQLVKWHTAPTWFRQKVRFMQKGRDDGGTVDPAQVEALQAELKAKLHAITYTSGKFAFRLIEPTEDEKTAGADAILQVLKANPTRELVMNEQPLDGFIGPITMNTGNHHPVAPPGFFLAWGPDIDTDFSAQAFRVQDVAPTVAYGLGLPISGEFDGVVIEDLFTQEFRNAHGTKTIATWGKRTSGATTASSADMAMIEELQALGYIE